MRQMNHHDSSPGPWCRGARLSYAQRLVRRLVWVALVALLCVALFTSCQLANTNQTIKDDRDFQMLGNFLDEFAETLPVKLQETPDYDSASDQAQFSFCPKPARPGIHLKNAVWLAFMAANEYSHLAAFAPVLSQLNFGTGGDMFWGLCARDLRKLYDLENQGKIPNEIDLEAMESWGVCSRDWYEESYLKKPAKPRPTNVAAAFESYLIQESSKASFLQFYSGGDFSSSRKTFKTGSTQVVWARHAELPIVVVAFRGTEPNALQDIVIDALAWKNRLSKHGWTEGWGKVHAGFMLAFRSISETIHPLTNQKVEAMLLEKLQEIEGGPETECTMAHPCLWVTGHSLGAALATLFVSRVLSEIERGKHYKLRGLYTFGSPRVGNKVFKQKFERLAKEHGITIGRFRNENDIVTRIPKFRYAHLDMLGFLTDQTGKVQFDIHINEPAVGSPSDHAMVKYYRKLFAALKNPDNTALSVCAYQRSQGK